MKRGFTLLETLIAMILMVLIVTSAVGFFRSQNQSFLSTSSRLDALQNARFALSQVERELRATGAGVPGAQPMLVYGDAGVVAINADYIERDTTGVRWAVYANPNVPDAATRAWALGDAGLIPTTSYVYPPKTFLQANGTASPAETHIFWLESDTSTARGDDFILWERVNSQPRDLVSRNVLALPGRPFFEYLMARRLATGADTLLVTPSALLPLIRVPLTSTMTSLDSANATRPDSVRAVRMNFRISNGLAGTDERLLDVSTVVGLPNNGLGGAPICGRAPFSPPTFTAVPDTVPGSGRVVLSWKGSPDQDSGEADVWQYVVYRRRSGAAQWETPLLNLASRAGTVNYTVTLGGNQTGAIYEFGASAQDCTPSMSPITSATVTAP